MATIPQISSSFAQVDSVAIPISAGNNVQPIPSGLPFGASVSAAPKPTAVQTAPQAVGYAVQ
jgi:hypothetical protein